MVIFRFLIVSWLWSSLPELGSAFLGRSYYSYSPPTLRAATSSHHSAVGDRFEIAVDLPPSGSGITANMKFESILSVPSQIIQVRYKIPFGLNVIPRKGLAVVSQDGPGGERVGDVLRYTSRWKLDLPMGGDGLTETVGSFAGTLSWQCSMFNVMKAKRWEQVVEALVSNTDQHTDEVVLIFERADDGLAPEVA